MANNTVIGSSIIVDGEISGEEPLVIQGTVKGQVTLQESVYVDKSGIVEANLNIQRVEISGQVVGDVIATERVEIKSDGKVIGNLKAPRILIADGAAFKGHIDMEF